MQKHGAVVTDRDTMHELRPVGRGTEQQRRNRPAGMSAAGEVKITFKGVMAHVATPVAVITALSGDSPYGTTVSAFASLSMNPPMILVSLAKTSDLLAVIRQTAHFGVNVLGSTHAGWAATFAGKGGTAKFAGIDWSLDDNLPRLSGTNWLACTTASLVDGGDHVIVLGDVLDAQPADQRPLTYHGRGFGTHTLLDTASSALCVRVE